ncbi:MAG: helix-turn-helix domain-containing protein [Candidatus Undinarchaeales archaeon]
MREKIEKISKDLLKFDLTEYQAKALAGVLLLGEGSASDIIKVTEIPKARIYGILDELVELGALRKKPGRPTKYISLGPEKTLQNIIDFRLDKAKKETKILSGLKENLVPEIKDTFKKSTPLKKKKSVFEIIPAGEVSEKETKKMYDSAEKRIYIMTGVFEYLPHVLTELKKAAGKGAKIKVVLKDKKALSERGRKTQEEILPVLENLKNTKVKVVKEMPLRLSLVDNNKVIFSPDEARYTLFLKELCISTNENMVSALAKYFESWWKK